MLPDKRVAAVLLGCSAAALLGDVRVGPYNYCAALGDVRVGPYNYCAALGDVRVGPCSGLYFFIFGPCGLTPTRRKKKHPAPLPRH